MPSELRYIAFDRKDLLEAVAVAPVRQFADLGTREIVDLVIRPVGGVPTVMVLLGSKDSTGFTERRLTKETVAAALVLYCRNHGVPLPKWGKSIHIEKDRVVMGMGEKNAMPRDPSQMGGFGFVAENTEAATASDALVGLRF